MQTQMLILHTYQVGIDMTLPQRQGVSLTLSLSMDPKQSDVPKYLVTEERDQLILLPEKFRKILVVYILCNTVYTANTHIHTS